jgi:hypothetical protein
MKRFLMVVCLAGAMSGSMAAASGAFPWLRTRPKPVLLDEQSTTATPVAVNRVSYRGTAVYSGSGRLFFPDARDRQAQSEEQSKSRLREIFSRAWHFGAAPSQTNSAKSK